VTGICRLCGCQLGERVVFPYFCDYLGTRYRYLKCTSCSGTILDPTPSEGVINTMYSGGDYLALSYEPPGEHTVDRTCSIILGLVGDLPALVLDYGCGTGALVQRLNSYSDILRAEGVEFDSSVCLRLSHLLDASIFVAVDFLKTKAKPEYDVIHLGDVLEHVPDPQALVGLLVNRIKDGGYLVVRGPLEANFSFILFCAKIWGAARMILRPGASFPGVPFHLFRAKSKAQKESLLRSSENLICTYWHVFEDGWPYLGNGIIRNSIANFGLLLSWILARFGFLIGNRFVGVFRVSRGNSV